MDAFYAQIEQPPSFPPKTTDRKRIRRQLRDEALTGRPVVVVQYPTTMHNLKDMAPDDNRIVQASASSIIAVSYEARPFGVKRGMKAGDAQKLCPDLSLVQVPTRNGKADISLYRRGGESVVSVLERAGGAVTAVEKASIDERRLGERELGEREVEGTCDASSLNGGEGKRWEKIGEGGWAAVLAEATATHAAMPKLSRSRETCAVFVNACMEPQLHPVAGLHGDDIDVVMEEASWWARPEEAFTLDEKLLACGAAVVSRMRAAVRAELQYSCTAGLAHNKLLAKLCSNMHKPNAQTVLPLDKVKAVFSTLPVEKVKGWGGKLGVKMMEKLGVSTAEIERWLSELSKELVLRLDEQSDREGQAPRKLTVSFAEIKPKGKPKAVSRCCSMVKPEVSAVVEACMEMVRAHNKEASRVPAV
eukprot:jgi/Undpi1/2084/HiC_scaffold_12.g05470.m1